MNQKSKHASQLWRLLIAGFIVAGALAGGVSALVPSKPKPVGAVVSYTSTIKGVMIDILSARDDAGRPFAHANAYYSEHGDKAAITMGAAPGGYGLPNWIEFEWREPAYPGIVRAQGESYEAWGAKVDEDTRKLVRKKQRVYVASKIPPEAIEEVRKSQAETVRGNLPNKMLWVYFVWTPTGIKVRWEVYRKPPGRVTPWQGDPLE